MTKVKTLRALVIERLAAAAEDISALFERATVEYEEELCCSEQHNQRTQWLLDQALSRRVLLNQGLNQDFTETAWIKEEPEEQSVTQEEEQLPVSVPESGAVRVKTEESSELQQGEDISSEPHFHSVTEGHTEHSSHTDDDDDWEPPLSWSAAQMQTEADGENYNQVQSRRNTKLSPNNSSAPETTVHNEDKLGPDGVEKKKHQCSVCEKRFGTKQQLQRHIRVHTGERPYSCSTCNKAFSHRSSLVKHSRTHTGERPFSCSTCNKAFTQRFNLITHRRTHTGEKPYNCSTCNKAFTQLSSLITHRRTHTGEKPHSCLICTKAFAHRSNLIIHSRTHTGEKPYSCSTCNKAFTHRSSLVTHRRTHTGEKPYTCSTCNKAFTHRSHLNTHRRIHTGEKAYKCLTCNKAFSYKYQLNKHMSTHGGQRPEIDGKQSI